MLICPLHQLKTQTCLKNGVFHEMYPWTTSLDRLIREYLLEKSLNQFYEHRFLFHNLNQNLFLMP